MSSSCILYEKRGRVGLITLSRPASLNAMNRGMVRELQSLLDVSASDDDVRVLVLTGAGRAFSAGIDLKEMADLSAANDREQEREELERLQDLTRRIVEHPKVVIAAVNGIAVGIGAELAIACDLRIAAETATMMFPEVKLGLFFTNGLVHLLPRLVGAARATRWLLVGDSVGASELLAAGVVSRLVPAEVVASVALSWANEIAGNAPLSMAIAKRMLRRSYDMDLEQALSAEVAGVMECSRSDDAREGLLAFREKRPPAFRGR